MIGFTFGPLIIVVISTRLSVTSDHIAPMITVMVPVIVVAATVILLVNGCQIP